MIDLYQHLIDSIPEGQRDTITSRVHAITGKNYLIQILREGDSGTPEEEEAELDRIIEGILDPLKF